MPDLSSAKWEGTLAEMLGIVEHTLREGSSGDDPAEQARRIVYGISSTMGGRMFYLPRGDQLKRSLRDSALYNEWVNGKGTIPDLARKYRLVQPTVYEIIKRQRELHRRSEPDLFGYGEVKDS
ncbi:TPA: transcriptional regulator [Pseudomonas aeruginosa]|nr:Mor transcription activator family protein [Pseudomonas aeruginosa]AXR14471.1 transcriptional regulator [Pseudomonas aeruginosa]EIU2598521.1 transcriptional regulator [Pseudomonas aeruginosa]EIU2879821.1 transcriptional regulator [Pseudomonas aeruginosa]ELC7283638.1 transcriptional regulator [Pseudomonas aeruginosa]ELK4865862.1 transcriptional regulator [Pseudomonas aeruginosa]